MAEKSAENEGKKDKPRIFKGTVHIIRSRCKGCGFCIEYCPKQILQVSKDFNEKGYHYPIVIKEEECVNCKVCEDICPEFSIYSIEKEETGEMEKDKKGTKGKSRDQNGCGCS